MAALRFSLSGSGMATGTTLRTILQVKAPANQRVKLLEFVIGFHGTSNTAEPILVQLFRQTTAGTMNAGTLVPLDDDNTEAIQSVGQYSSGGAEPNAGAILKTFTVHPQSGMIYQVPKGDEICIKGGGRVGLVVTAPAGVNCDASMTCEE